MTLSTKQRAYLRSLSQHLKPQLHIGHAGFNEELHLGPLLDLFKRRELVKARVLNTTEEEPDRIAERLAAAAGAHVVGVVGNNFVLYRPNPDVKEPIQLPERGSSRSTRS